jgi:hypothetical protein
VGDDGLFWKEVLHRTGPWAPDVWQELALPTIPAAVVTTVVWGMLGVLAWLSRSHGGYPIGWRDALPVINGAVRVGTVFLLTFFCVAAGFLAAGSVSRERDRRTLDGLLTLPLTRAALLRAKGLGCVLRPRYFLYVLALLWFLGAATGGLHPLALLLLALTAATHIASVVSLGVWVSVIASSTVRANFLMALVLLLYFAAGWLLYGAPSAVAPPGDFVRIGLNPCRSWWTLAFPVVGARGENHVAVLAAAAGCVCFAALAAVVWLLAVRRFRGE